MSSQNSDRTTACPLCAEPLELREAFAAPHLELVHVLSAAGEHLVGPTDLRCSRSFACPGCGTPLRLAEGFPVQEPGFLRDGADDWRARPRPLEWEDPWL